MTGQEKTTKSETMIMKIPEFLLSICVIFFPLMNRKLYLSTLYQEAELRDVGQSQPIDTSRSMRR